MLLMFTENVGGVTFHFTARRATNKFLMLYLSSLLKIYPVQPRCNWDQRTLFCVWRCS